MFSTQLAQRAAENNPIRVGIIGAGKFGAGLVAQLSQMQGMVASAIADINLKHAIDAYTVSNIPPDAISYIRNVNEMNDAIRSGKRVVTEDGMHIIQSDLIDVVVEATGIPEVGRTDGISHADAQEASRDGQRRDGRYHRSFPETFGRQRRCRLYTC